MAKSEREKRKMKSLMSQASVIREMERKTRFHKDNSKNSGINENLFYDNLIPEKTDFE